MRVILRNARAIAIFIQKEKDQNAPVYSSSQHDATILNFARTFMGIVNAAVSRPSLSVQEDEAPLQTAKGKPFFA